MSIVILPALGDVAKGGRRLSLMPAPPLAGISPAFLRFISAFPLC
jgi:hypothetical protein